MTLTKEQVIDYFIDLKNYYNSTINDIVYTDITKSLTFKQLQDIDHLRTNISKIYKIIEFLEKEGN